ncbi:MAG: hypothetical protein JXA90_02205 [Planctomycetes bacterium]|nr:hypothetical protein [Planctomycetota bacterium]
MSSSMEDFMRTSFPPRALFLSLAIAGAALFAAAAPESDGGARSALESLKKALRADDMDAIEDALSGVVRAGGADSARRLLSLIRQIPSSRESLYWSLLRGAVSFTDRPALGAVGEFIVKNRAQPVARDVLYALSRNTSRQAPAALRPVLLDESAADDLRVQAAAQLGFIRSPAAVDALIEVLKAEEKRGASDSGEPVITVIESLTNLTGKKYGFNSVNWEGWWKKNQGKPLAGRQEQDRSETGTAVDSLDVQRRERYLALERAPKKGVVVLSAVFTKKSHPVLVRKDLNNDHMDEVLERMNIPHTVVEREDFLDFDLRETGAILINCTQFHRICICPFCKPGKVKNDRLYPCTGCDKHIPFSAELTGPQIEKLKSFVKSGGYIFCEDWVVKELMEKAYPESVTAGDKLAESSVDVVPVRGMALHPYLKGIFVPGEDGGSGGVSFDLDLDFSDEEDGEEEKEEKAAGGAGRGKTVVAGVDDEEPEPASLLRIRHEWWIDDESYALRVRNAQKVVGLLGSGELQKKLGADSLVALAVRPGSSVPPGQPSAPRGRLPGVVMVVLSHFGKQGSREDEHAIENLLLNFLLEANVEREARAAPRRKEP